MISSLFGRDARAEREEKRQARLRAAAASAPVIAQRPVAPLRVEGERDDVKVNMTSYSDSGGVSTVISSSGEEINDDIMPQKQTQSVPSESYESMAMLGTTITPAQPPSSPQGNICRGCNSPVSIGERFCPHCGLDI
jgi:hypothetical protein